MTKLRDIVKVVTVTTSGMLILRPVPGCCEISKEVKGNDLPEDDFDIDPLHVKEEGCPMVHERDKLNIAMVKET